MATSQSVTLFISYAHRDEELKSQLDKHLTPLKLQKVIDKWSDRQIEGGQDWAHQIDSNLKSADIILLLVSPDFVSSDYCAGIELKAAMTRYRDGDAIVVPVILEPCDWKWLDFGKLQATPKDGKAITDWPNVNSAFLDVTNTIRQVAQGLLDKRQKREEERQAASERYKAKVEEVLSDGDITPLERKTLNELRDKLGLTADEAEAIKDSAYQPLREYQSKLAQYRVDLVETIQHEYPLSERTKVDLKQRQRELGLKAEDADRMEAELLAGAEASYQAQLKSGEAAVQRAREASERQAQEEADRRAREADEQRQRAAMAAQREREMADQRQAAESAQRMAAEAAQRAAEAEAALEARRLAEEAGRRRLEDERQQQDARLAREAAQALQVPEAVVANVPPPTSPGPTVPPPSVSKPAAPAVAASVANGAPAQPAITLRMRMVAAGIAAVVSGAAMLIGPSFAEYGGVDSGVAVLFAVFGAIAGAIIAGYRWIAVAAVAAVLLMLANHGEVNPGAWLLVFALLGGSVVIPVRRRLRQRKSRSGVA